MRIRYCMGPPPVLAPVARVIAPSSSAVHHPDERPRLESTAFARGNLARPSMDGPRYRVAMPSPKEILEIGGHEVAISNPQKVYFPDSGYTKLDLVHYYLA